MIKAIIVKDKNPDVYRLVRIGCAEAKKALSTKEHVTPIDFINRPYGCIVVVEFLRSLHERNPVVRTGKVNE